MRLASGLAPSADHQTRGHRSIVPWSNLMPIAIPQLDAQSAQPVTGGDFHSRDFAGKGDRMPALDRLPEAISPSIQTTTSARASSLPIPPSGLNDLVARMQLLIRIEGSTAAIAQRSGFSEDTVRDWCRGRGDLSREHCIIVARTLGISLRWLVAGEGSMHEADDSIRTSMERAAPAAPADDVTPVDAEVHIAVDPNLLAAAFRVLQSYIGLVGGSLNPTQRADSLAQIYHVLGHASGPGNADRVVALHSMLGGYFCSRKSLIG
ncbi:helix-turn-helix domain-containing protein [Rhodanobacter sp. 7MK24]|uniref:helix-turn-helix domain-containing protein n=1 Tax=Rhodanobacter sp. 7MK24 TaxID=2775922 RepID=UPI0017873C04|nr:helix-turn-helix domain-containing protein [Rhodanobacter sp. 7MK24]MBD8881212.1 helix-turn-helix domain-containing protein [Rhodanobacter sp. 7MK24]